jgi:hypothetical protein
MFTLRTARTATPPASRARQPRRARPVLEQLEGRDAPATVTLAVEYGVDKSVKLYGTLSGASNSAHQPVSLGGVVAGLAMTNMSGYYETIVKASALGDVTARWVGGGVSNTAVYTLTDVAPAITSFSAVEGQDHVWTLSGTVSYSRPFTSLTVLFAGEPVTIYGTQTTTDSTGYFERVYILNGQSTDNGTVTAKAIDAWGTESALATTYICQTGT